jgi:hypothetical protein
MSEPKPYSDQVPRKCAIVVRGKADLHSAVNYLLGRSMFFSVMPFPDDEYEIAVRDDDSARPILRTLANELRVFGHQEERYRTAAENEHHGSDEFQVDPFAVVSLSGDGEGAWVQVWQRFDADELDELAPVVEQDGHAPGDLDDFPDDDDDEMEPDGDCM